MSATQGKKPPKECVKFEPQTWRKNLCQNCFKTADQHGGGGADPSPKAEGNAKDKAKIKSKDQRGDPAGKKAGGIKAKGDASKTTAADKKGDQEKINTDIGVKSGKDKIADKKEDKKDKPLFGRFADKAKEKVIEASQAVDKKTTLGGKKKGVDIKPEDKSDKSGKDSVSKDKAEKKVDTSLKSETKDAKPKTPTFKAKKKWPFEAESPVEKTKGKFDKPVLKPKEQPTVKKKVSDKTADTTSTKEIGKQKQSPKSKEDISKTVAVSKSEKDSKATQEKVSPKTVTTGDNTKPVKPKPGEAKNSTQTNKKEEKSQSDKTDLNKTERKAPAKDEDKSHQAKAKPDSKVKTNDAGDEALALPPSTSSEDSILHVADNKSIVKTTGTVEKQGEKGKPIASVQPNRKVISPERPLSHDAQGTKQTKADKTVAGTDPAAEAKTVEPERQAEETKPPETGSPPENVPGGTLSHSKQSKANITLGSRNETKENNDKPDSGKRVSSEIEAAPPSPTQRPQVKPLDNAGGLLDMSEIGPLSPGITTEINGSKVIIEFRKRETPPVSPNKGDNLSSPKGAGETSTFNKSARVSPGGGGGGGTEGEAEAGSKLPVVVGSNLGAGDKGPGDSQQRENGHSQPAASSAGTADVALPSGASPDGFLSTHHQPPVVTSQAALHLEPATEKTSATACTDGTPCTPASGSGDWREQAGQDKNTSPLAGRGSAEPRKDDPPAWVTGSESEISPEIASANSADVHSEANSQVGSDVSTNRKPPGPRSEEQASVSPARVTGEVKSEEASVTPKLDLSAPESQSTRESSPSGGQPSGSAPTTPLRAEATITLIGTPSTGGGEDSSTSSSAGGSATTTVSSGASPDFTLPRSVEINPDEVIVHTGPTYHSAEEATTSFITEESSYSPSQQTGVTSSIFRHQPAASPSGSGDDLHSQQRSQSDDDASIGGSDGQSRRRRRDRQQQVRRRQRQSYDDSDYTGSGSRYGDSMALNVTREDAMMEGTRMLIDNLREKVAMMEDRGEKSEREKMALADLLTVKKSEYVEMRSKYRGRISDLEDDVGRLQSEKDRLIDKLKLPESERASLAKTDQEIAMLQKRIDELENQTDEVLDDNLSLKQEVKDLQLEMEEMHDQFREEEALEFRELQKELEATAKNCRILQFKLRKAERRNEQIENDRIIMEDKIRQMEHRFSKSDDKQLVHELVEELKMAKEVSVRLHDELEMVEEKRARYEEELDRVNDILTESESRRQALQREVESLQDENDKIKSNEQSAAKDTLGVPTRAPLLGQTKKEGSKEGSMEYDVAQLMRDLSDSLERENDLKEQLKFAEEEARIMRKKLSDMDEENESLTLQLQKISAAKSPKHFRKTSNDGEVITEREHELKLQMELAENEVIVLKRKLNEMDQENENLLSDVKFFQAKLEGKIEGKLYRPSIDEDDRPLEEQITSMAKEIDTLKWKLTDQDIEAEDKMRGGRGILKKSKSLEEDMHQPGRGILGESPDTRAQLERVEQEADVLKDKLLRLEKENERLFTENKKLQLMSSRKVPSITTDDAALQNIELQEKVAQLENENVSLRDSLRSLDDRTAQLSRQVSRASSSESLLTSDPSEARLLRDQLRSVDEECKMLRRKVAELESSNIKLSRELRKYRKEEDSSERGLSKLSKEELKERVMDLESELNGLIILIKNREDEIDRLETDIEGNKFDMDKMAEVFKSRESELVEEADMIQQKNNVLSNLLDLVTERAESTQKELEKYIRESEASLSCPTSPISETLTEKEKKKKSKDKDKVLVAKDWEETMKKRVLKLEKTLAETKEKLEAKERKLEAKDTKMTGIKRDTKVNKKEMDVLHKELALCTKQLKESMEEVKEFKQRLKTVQESHNIVKDDYNKVYHELTEEKDKYTKLEALHEDEKAKEKVASKPQKPEKEPASWRWEKKQLEDHVKELEKNVDKLKSELKQQHFKWKLAGEDKEKEVKMKDRLDNQIKNLKTQLEENKVMLEEAKSKTEEVEKGFKVKEDQWLGERKFLEDNANAAEKQSKNKDDALNLKDGIIEEKDALIKEKTKAVKDKEKNIKKQDEIIKNRDDEIKDKIKAVSKSENDVSKAKAETKNIKQQLVEKDDTIKALNVDVRRRDDRIKEKDEILDKINRKLKERDQEFRDMDNSIRQIMKKLQDKEVELKLLKSSAEKSENEVKKLTNQLKELESNLNKSETKQKAMQSKCEQKDKLEGELSTLTKEKKALLNDLDNAKVKLKSSEEKWKKEKTKLELDIKQNKEKIHSLQLSGTMKQGEVVKTLSNEKEKLISDKHKLSDDINRLRKEFQESTKQWNSEREDLQKIISEKTKMVEDNNVICERMQKDMDSLKTKVSKGSGNAKPIPIKVQHEGADIKSFPVRVQTETDKKSKEKADSSSTKDKELQIKLEQKELMFNAEKAGLEELYEGRIKLSQENLSHSHDQVTHLKKENQAQLELLQSSRKALADIRSRYDAALLSWNEDKETLEKKLGKINKNNTGDSIGNQIKELQVNLQDAEATSKSAEVKLKADQAAWKIEKSSLEKKLKAATAAPAGATPGRAVGGVSEFRAKFERFESKKAPAAKAGTASTSTIAEDKTVTEALKAVKDLKKQLDSLEKECAKNKNELIEKIEKPTTLKKDKVSESKEKKELKERNSQLEQKLTKFEDTSKSLVDLQCVVQEDREKWQREKNKLFKQLDDTKHAHSTDKEKINELLAELKKLKTLAPALENGQDRRSRLRRTPSVERRKSTTLINLSADDKKKDKDNDDEVKRTLDQALEHISRLAEAFNQAPAQVHLRPSERKSQAPPQFRRSLSTSEIEDGPQTYVGLAPDSLIFHPYIAPKVKAAPSPIILPRPPVSERSSRPREPRRSVSTTEDEQPYDSATVDRRSYRAGAGQEHKRSSIHASGTMSAATSRDASPEKGFRFRRISPFPVAPPSMIITPSHTPRREHSVERGAEDSMAKSDMDSLYAKLSEIESKEASKSKEKAIQKERGQKIRVLMHSSSVDNAIEEPLSPPPPSASDQSPAVGASAYSDATPSQSLPATIRHSNLFITPGVEKFSLGYRKKNQGKEKRSASVSPKTARKQFYNEYPYEPKNIFSRLTRKLSTSDLSSAEASRDNTLQKQVSAPAESLSRGRDKEKDKSMFSSASNFFDAVKQKRKMFGSKKATSVDNSAVHAEIARMGTTVLPTPAAPSNYEPPEVPPPEEKKEKKSKRPFRRSASIDAGSLFSTRGSGRRSQSSDRQPLLPADTSSSDSRGRSRKPDGIYVEDENSRAPPQTEAAAAASVRVPHNDAIPPPLTSQQLHQQQFTRPPALADRKPPVRWLSLKKAMLEQPIVIRERQRDQSSPPPPSSRSPPPLPQITVTAAPSSDPEARNFTETSV